MIVKLFFLLKYLMVFWKKKKKTLGFFASKIPILYLKRNNKSKTETVL